jgi:hypothetical protein
MTWQSVHSENDGGDPALNVYVCVREGGKGEGGGKEAGEYFTSIHYKPISKWWTFSSFFMFFKNLFKIPLHR